MLQAIFASCKAFKMQAPGVPPPRPLLVANFGGVPAFQVPISEWGREHYRKELCDRAPRAEEKADVADGVARMASALSGPQRNQLSAAKKRVLSIGLIRDCGRFGAPLPFPHAPLFLEEEEHL